MEGYCDPSTVCADCGGPCKNRGYAICEVVAYHAIKRLLSLINQINLILTADFVNSTGEISHQPTWRGPSWRLAVLVRENGTLTIEYPEGYYYDEYHKLWTTPAERAEVEATDRAKEQAENDAERANPPEGYGIYF